MGPILPFLPVYGKQLGISAFVMGCVTAILPILYFLAKPLFGFIVDYFRSLRKFLFILLLLITSFCYIFMYFIPNISGPVIQDNNFVNISYDNVPECYNVVSLFKFLFIFNMEHVYRAEHPGNPKIKGGGGSNNFNLRT